MGSPARQEIADRLEEQRAANAARAAEVVQLLNADLFRAWDYLCRDAHMQDVRGTGVQLVYAWILRNTGGWFSWTTRPATYLEIADDMGAHRRTVARGIRKLEELGRIHVEPLGPCGNREGAIYTLLLPEAAKRPRRRKPAPEGQEHLDTVPEWVKHELTAAGDVTGWDMSPAGRFVLEQQGRQQLTATEMAAWIEAAAQQTGRDREKPIAYFRTTLQGMLRDRGDRRAPPQPKPKASRFLSIDEITGGWDGDEDDA